MNILLVEPDEQLGQIYSQALQRAGHKVDWRRDAQTAIEAADQTRPEAVILEVQLARHNGIEFLYEFRSYPDWQKTPVILHTNALGLPSSEDLLARLGVHAVHYKPQTSLAQLVTSLGRLPAVA
jgi:DNA-binding response OmpR family regulator